MAAHNDASHAFFTKQAFKADGNAVLDEL